MFFGKSLCNEPSYQKYKLTWISALFCGNTGQYTLFFYPSGKIGWATDNFTFYD